MHRIPGRCRVRRGRDDRGFSLVEMAVVVVILGVLIAIAVPVYLNYRRGADDAAAESDLRNAISALAGCSDGRGQYPVQPYAVTIGSATDVTSVETCAGHRYSTSAGTSIRYQTNATGTCYVIVSTNGGGASKYWLYSSTAGGGISPSSVSVFNSPPAC